MNRRIAYLALIVCSTSPSAVFGAATMTFDLVNPPTLGVTDIGTLDDTIGDVGATTPGGGAYNAQSFSDNGGPPGQTFTTLTGAALYRLDSVSLKGQLAGTSNAGNAIFSAGTTWALRISAVSGTTLTPVKVITGIPTAIDPALDGDEWYSWNLTGLDTVALDPNKSYAFEIYSSTGYLGFDAGPNTAYAGGEAFNSAGGGRSFAGNTTGNLATHNYDRTFALKFSVPPVGTVAGDANGSGMADATDYTLIRNNLEKSVTAFSSGDLDGNGVVNLNDFRRWTKAVPPAVAAGVGVPEPAAALLAFVALASGASLRGRRQSF